MAELPNLDLKAFAEGLQELSEPARRLPEEALRRLHAHYRELKLWNRRLALIGPGTEAEALERHYAESLAAAPMLFPGGTPAEPSGQSLGPNAEAGQDSAPGPGPGKILLDVGTGAGFPGWVLAAAYPSLGVVLVEARQRKWAFLQSAARKAALPIQCLDARVGLPLPAELPPEVDWITMRALRLPPTVLGALAERLRPGGSILLWQGKDDPDLPPELEIGSDWPLPGSRQRRILRVIPRGGSGGGNESTETPRSAKQDRRKQTVP